MYVKRGPSNPPESISMWQVQKYLPNFLDRKDPAKKDEYFILI